MQVIEQQAKVEFFAPSVQDVIDLLPLMDGLCNDVAHYIKYLKESKKEDKVCHKILAEKKRALGVLLGMGFRPSNPEMLDTAFNLKV